METHPQAFSQMMVLGLGMAFGLTATIGVIACAMVWLSRNHRKPDMRGATDE